MTDSMNFGPDWIRNLSSDGNTGGGTTSGTRYQLADYRYGREEMLALFDRNIKPPASLTNFKSLYEENTLLPLALIPTTDEERGNWPNRPTTLVGGPPRGRGGSLERGGRISRGRGGYPSYGRTSGYDGGWGNGEQPDWSPRKEYNPRNNSMDNWRRGRSTEEDDTWRNMGPGRTPQEKWGRSTSWRGEGDSEERNSPPERGGRQSWNDTNRVIPRRGWDEDHLPEWANENPTDGGGSFDERGAFHGSDDEQADPKSVGKRETGLQKSTSQQHISNKTQHPPLPTSKSTMSLVKPHDQPKEVERPHRKEKPEESKTMNENGVVDDRPSRKVEDKIDKSVIDRIKAEEPQKTSDKEVSNGQIVENRVEEDFDRLQEDLVLKLVVDEEPPKPTLNSNSFDVGGVQPPPNLTPPGVDKWFYQDPQGQTQGPFPSLEMAEWFKAGYFSHQLKVRRHCDERFFMLGELLTMSGGANPFQSGVRFSALKNETPKLPAEQDVLQYQYLSQMAAYKQAAQARAAMAEPWNTLALQQQQQQELAATQRLMMHQQQLPQDLQYIQQPPPTNPLMHMINQMQQASKLHMPGMVDKPSSNPPPTVDPILQMQMASLHNLPNRLPTTSMTGLPTTLSGSLPPEGLVSGLGAPGFGSAAGLPMPGMQNTLTAGLGGMSIPRPASHSSVDQLSSGGETDPIASLLKQLQQQKQQNQQQQLDSLWQQNQYNVQTPTPPQMWQPPPEVPLSLWEISQQKVPTPSVPVPVSSNSIPAPVNPVQVHKERIPTPPDVHPVPVKPEKDSEVVRLEKDTAVKEQKKKKEQDEKQAKKEAEDKRKQEQKRAEVEKKVAEEKKRKEEERIRKDLEKSKKEAEEKRLRELEEKRRLKEQRKAEEEARKKSEELKRLEEERLKREGKELEERKQAEALRLAQEQVRIAKAAPWCQSGSSLGMSLADIQKAEKERRAQEAALQLQKQQQLQQELQQQQLLIQQEKPSGIQLSWAKKPVEPRKVKSLAEIQAEEQERLAKQAAEARLQKEKEVPVVTNVGNIWSTQNLSWAAASFTSSQWSNNGTDGFWDESTQPLRKPNNKPSTLTKTTSAVSVNSKLQQPTQKPQKSKPKKDETSSVKVNNNHGPTTDEFTNWCYKTLSNITTDVDVPTFVTFLRDLESAMEVRDYCKEYLGESQATQQFASNFLEKRRSFRPRNNAHKDDMCSPAPAITPSLHNNNDFQEVKGKNKKNKKSKMLKVDARILGFNVTSAPDRINVGDRDYGDTS